MSPLLGPVACLTFIQPVAEAVVNDALLPSRDDADGLLPDVCTVVDVVFKDKYLVREEKNTALTQKVAIKRVLLKSPKPAMWFAFAWCLYLTDNGRLGSCGLTHGRQNHVSGSSETRTPHRP